MDIITAVLLDDETKNNELLKIYLKLLPIYKGCCFSQNSQKGYKKDR